MNNVKSKKTTYLKNKMKKFNKRWGITSNESYEEAFKKFKVRILNIFEGIDRYISTNNITLFCQYYGIREERHLRHRHSQNTIIFNRLIAEDNEKEFYRLIELIFSLEMMPRSYRDDRKIFFQKISETIELSNVNVSITISHGEIILYPKGEKKFDEELVDAPLSFLDKKSSEHFIQALQFYQSKKYVKSAESLRRSLEEFFRYKFDNKKGLNSNISELQKHLKNNGKDSKIRNIIFQTFSYLDNYFDENSKHNDGNINDSENEFLLYQIGLLMRYINLNVLLNKSR